MEKEAKPPRRRPSGFIFVWPVSNAEVEIVEQLDQPAAYWQLSLTPGGLVEQSPLDSSKHEIWKEGPMLRLAPSASADSERSEPMQVRNLHRVFSEIQDASDAIRFARKFGLLGRVMFHDLAPPQIFSEPLYFWLVHAKRIRVLLRLIALSLAGERECRAALKGHVGFMGGDFGHLIGEPENDWLRWPRLPAESMAGMANRYVDHYRLPDRMGNTIEESLAKTGFKYTIWAQLVIADTLNTELADGVRCAFLGSSGAPLSYAPRDLLGALYAHVADEYMRNTRPSKKCPGCGRWFAPIDRRKTHCDATCRQRALRAKRRQQARLTQA